MKNFFVPNPGSSLFRGILTIVIGGVLIFVPGLTMRAVMIIIGAMLLLNGVITIILSNVRKSSATVGLFPFQGILNIVFGIVFIASPTMMVKIFVFVLGLILLLMGFFQLAGALGILRRSAISWIYLMIGILTFASGIYLITGTMESAETILQFLGVILIINGLSELVMAWQVRRRPTLYKGSAIQDVTYEEV